MGLIVCTYWTDARYHVAAKAMLFSAEVFGFRAIGYERPDLGSWTKNVNQKPDVIAEAIGKHPGESILYVDADARFVGVPDLVTGTHRNLAAYFRAPGSPCGGTLLFRDGEESRRVLSDWAERIAARPDLADDRVHLRDAFVGHRVFILPPSYCWHEKTMRPRFPTATPVISHDCIGKHDYARK